MRLGKYEVAVRTVTAPGGKFYGAVTLTSAEGNDVQDRVVEFVEVPFEDAAAAAKHAEGEVKARFDRGEL